MAHFGAFVLNDSRRGDGTMLGLGSHVDDCHCSEGKPT